MNKEHLLSYLEKGIRYDGRKLNEYRDIKIEYDVSKSAEGSAQVSFGSTIMIAGVKMAVQKPYEDMPDAGTLMVNAELLPLSSPEFETGPPGIYAVELARVVDRGIRESHAIDTHKLCIEAGESVWSVSIDVCSINAHGGLIDASSLAALAALKDARMPAYKDKVVDYGNKTDQSVPMEKEPIAVTVFKIDKYLIVDPIPEEEKFADARLTITVTKDNVICSLQKGGAVALTVDEIDSMVALAIEKAPELRSKL